MHWKDVVRQILAASSWREIDALVHEVQRTADVCHWPSYQLEAVRMVSVARQHEPEIREQANRALGRS